MDAEKLYFEDLSKGQALNCSPVPMRLSAIKRFAREFDPQLFHLDEHIAKASIFKGIVASSVHTIAACTRSVVEAQGNLAIISGIGMHAVKMHHPVRPGDILLIEARWTGLRRSATRPDRGIAAIRCRVTNQKEESVIEYGYQYLIQCRNKERTPNENFPTP